MNRPSLGSVVEGHFSGKQGQSFKVSKFEFQAGGRRSMKTRLLWAMGWLVLALAAQAQRAPDPQLMQEINRIPAIDDHTHIPKVVAAGEGDDDYDALPCAPLETTA